MCPNPDSDSISSHLNLGLPPALSRECHQQVQQDDSCCPASTLPPWIPEVEVHAHQAALETLRELTTEDVCSTHYSDIISRTWYHARRVLEITGDVRPSAAGPGLDASLWIRVVTLALEVWTFCGSTADVADNTSRWNRLTHTGVEALDRLLRDRDVEGEDDPRQRLSERLSGVWSAVMLQPHSPAIRAFFLSHRFEADPSPTPWWFISNGNRAACLQVLLRDQRPLSEEHILLIDGTA